MQVSVIIPVYNAERYLNQAVESALMQEETGEILLVEDGSPDNALEVCRELVRKYDKVKLFQHPDKGNHGAGASRNLGIRNATCEYIAFLDADDYMLPDRFKTTKEVFERNPDADGVYEAVGVHFEDEDARRRWFEFRSDTITTVHDIIEPHRLFEKLVKMESGYFCTIGIVFKTSFVTQMGFFDENLMLSQDSHFFLRASALGRLYPGSIQVPVANRRIHAENRSNRSRPEAREWNYRMWKSLFDHMVHANTTASNKVVVYDKYFLVWKHYHGIDKGAEIRFFLLVCRKYPFVVFKGFLWEVVWQQVKRKLGLKV